jgi:8-oxo-dGTP pyrophosphatase MutT (NUDIX family)
MAMHTRELQKLTESLKKAPPLIGSLRHRHAAVLLPLIENNGDYHLLFEERAPDIPQGSEICFPGGEFDDASDSTPLATAIRETSEELGLPPGKIEVIGQLGTIMALRSLIVDCFVGLLRIRNISELTIDSREVARLFTLPVAWFCGHPPEHYPIRMEMQAEVIEPDGTARTLFPARELGLPKRYWTSWSGGTHTTPVYRTPEGVIWGLTGQMVEELTGRLPSPPA